MRKLNLKSVLTFTVLIFILSLNIQLSKTEEGFNLFGYELKINHSEIHAGPEQNFKMSM